MADKIKTFEEFRKQCVFSELESSDITSDTNVDMDPLGAKLITHLQKTSHMLGALLHGRK